MVEQGLAFQTTHLPITVGLENTIFPTFTNSCKPPIYHRNIMKDQVHYEMHEHEHEIELKLDLHVIIDKLLVS